MGNIQTARELLELAAHLGVAELCLCGGSRNAPLLAVGAAFDFRKYAFFDERAAGFFAIGRARRTSRPVAVITTSGTAAAELLPAAIEAHYSGTPLLLITADRPARYRGTGAPQAIEQSEIFGPYAQRMDMTAGEAIPAVEWCHAGPLHINVAFDEPLIDESERRGEWARGREIPLAHSPTRPVAYSKLAALTEALRRWQRPLLLLGGLTAEDRDQVRAFALKLGAPVYAEPPSGLREDVALKKLLIQSGERILRQGGFDGIIRIGDVPALRFWRDLDESLPDLPVVSLNRLQFSGLSRGTMIHAPIAESLRSLKSVPMREMPEFQERDGSVAQRMSALFESEPRSEPSIFRELSRAVTAGSHVYLGNSLPVREWDLAAVRDRAFDYSANRGANGIDGQISTFLGYCREDVTNWCVVGDLTALYDLSAPWIVNQLDPRMDFRIVIVNNGGGRIFSRVASLKSVDPRVRDKYFEDAHGVRFEHWARMWGLEYRIESGVKPPHSKGVLEIVPDAEATRRFWQTYDELWSAG